MFESIENIRLINCTQGVSRTYLKIPARKCHSFNFRVTGTAVFEFSGQRYTVQQGEMIFIPQGVVGTVTTSEEDVSTHLVLSFQAAVETPKPKVYSAEAFPELGELSAHMVPLWRTGGEAERLKCLSLFYGLLSKIVAIDRADYATRKKYGMIEPAVQYLREHIFEADLKTDCLHSLCGISGAYFRRIFLSEFGTSPQKYIINKRLSHAKTLLDSGDYISVSQVAAEVGYSDPLYFSRVFRKKYGFCPTQSIHGE